MFINIAQIKTKKGVKNGLRYQMKNGRGEILTGSPEMVKNWAATSNSESVKAFSILITFKESKAELEEKLRKQGYAVEELFEDIERLIFAGYQREELAYSMIAHADTDHYHIHTYLANNYAGTGKTIRFFFHERDLTAIKQFIALKYDLDIQASTPKAGRTRKVGSSHWTGKAKEKEEAKDEIHEVIMEDVLQGRITDNQQVRERMEFYTELSEGTLKEVKITKLKDGTIREIDKSVKAYGDKVLIKMYKNSISIIKKDGFKFSLKGGIYRENWTAAQNNIKVKEVLDGLIGYLERRLKETERYNKDRQKRQAEQPEYKTEILGESFLTFLKKIKQNQLNQNQQQKQPQQKQPQHQKQTQPQKQNQTTSQPQQKQTQQTQKQPTRDNQTANHQKLIKDNQTAIDNIQNLQDNQPTREDYQQEQTRDQQEQYYLQDYIPRPRMRL